MTRAMQRFALPHLSDEAVAAYADGVLSGGPTARAQHHLAECADCAAAVQEQQQARSVLRSAAAPMVPGPLLARLRELPTSAPLGGQTVVIALSVDGCPVFRAFDSRQGRPQPGVPSSAGAPSVTHTATHRRRGVPGLGISAAAAATLIVGVLATTAVTEGRAATSPHSVPQVNSPAPLNVGTGNTVPILDLIGPR